MRRVLSAAVVAAIASLSRRPRCGRLVLAGRRAAPAAVLARGRRVRGRPAPRHRHRRRGRRARAAPAGGIVSFVGPVPAGGRASRSNGRRLRRDAAPARLDRRRSRKLGRGRRGRRQVGASEDAVTTVPHVHLGIRVAAEPNGYVDPVLLLPARPGQPSPTPAPSPEPTPVPAVADEGPAVVALEPVPPAEPAPAAERGPPPWSRGWQRRRRSGQPRRGSRLPLSRHRASRASPCVASARSSTGRRRWMCRAAPAGPTAAPRTEVAEHC